MFFMIIFLGKIKKPCWILFCYCNMQRNKEDFKNFAMKQKGVFFFGSQWWGERKPCWFFYFVVATHERMKDLASLNFFVLLLWCMKEQRITFFLFCCLDGQRNERKASLIFLVVMHEAMKESLIDFIFFVVATSALLLQWYTKELHYHVFHFANWASLCIIKV